MSHARVTCPIVVKGEMGLWKFIWFSDKLQCEMLRQDLDNEDELLLALAGLKQVGEVIKLTLVVKGSKEILLTLQCSMLSSVNKFNQMLIFPYW